MDKEEDCSRNKDHVTMSCRGKVKSSLHPLELVVQTCVVVVVFNQTKIFSDSQLPGRHKKQVVCWTSVIAARHL